MRKVVLIFIILVAMVIKARANEIGTADGRYFRLFVPFTFYHQHSESISNPLFNSKLSTDSKLSTLNSQLSESLSLDSTIDEEINKVMMNIYLKRPDLVVESQKNLEKVGGLKVASLPTRESTEEVKVSPTGEDLDGAHLGEALGGPVEVVIEKPKFWTFSQDYYLQFLQNFFSDNWYKAGETNYSLLGNATLQMNYNNKQKVKFDNKLELKFGLQTSESDTLHKARTSSDLIRYTGKVGVQATKQWYYSCQLIAHTQFTHGHKSNDTKIYSDFMSPFNANLSLGLEYAIPAKYKKKVTGTLSLSPLAYNFRYVDRLDLATRYSLDEGKHTLHDFGSSLTFNFKWTPSDNFSYETRLWAYTTYKRSEMEWENTFVVKIAKFISAKLFIYPRFDDAAAKDDNWGFFQLKEYTSIGFSYSL